MAVKTEEQAGGARETRWSAASLHETVKGPRAEMRSPLATPRPARRSLSRWRDLTGRSSSGCPPPLSATHITGHHESVAQYLGWDGRQWLPEQWPHLLETPTP